MITPYPSASPRWYLPVRVRTSFAHVRRDGCRGWRVTCGRAQMQISTHGHDETITICGRPLKHPNSLDGPHRPSRIAHHTSHILVTLTDDALRQALTCLVHPLSPSSTPRLGPPRPFQPASAFAQFTASPSITSPRISLFPSLPRSPSEFTASSPSTAFHRLPSPPSTPLSVSPSPSRSVSPSRSIYPSSSPSPPPPPQPRT